MTLISFEQFGYSKPDARENKRSENQKKKNDNAVLTNLIIDNNFQAFPSWPMKSVSDLV